MEEAVARREDFETRLQVLREDYNRAVAGVNATAGKIEECQAWLHWLEQRGSEIPPAPPSAGGQSP
jgi:hypothetical protein